MSGNMTETFKNHLRSYYTAFTDWLEKPRSAFIFGTAYLVLTTLWVYFDPLSLFAFLFFIASAYLVYALHMKIWQKVILGVLLALFIVPVVGARNISYLEVIFQISVFSALALGLNIVVGFTGLLNMGFAAFYLVGAYLWAFFGCQQIFLLHSVPGTAPPNTPFMLPANMFYLFMFLGMLAAALVGFLLGLPVMRVRGDYLAIVTLGFGEVLRVLMNNLDKPINLTNGSQGITPIQRPTLPQPVLNLINSILTPVVGNQITSDEFYNIFFYLLALIVIGLIILTTIRLNESKVGRAWAAIREDELAASSMGVHVVVYKLGAFVVGASFAGIMGVIFASDRTFVSPEYV